MALVTAYLGLGSNLGDRLANLQQAVDLVRLPGQDLTALRSSPVYETAPWGVTDQPDFLNCVLEIGTTLDPAALLQWVKRIEASMGREWSPRFGPRKIDIDILLYGNDTVDEPDLQVPHVRLHERAFVLIPLGDLTRTLRHPALGKTIEELASMVPDPESVRPWGPPLRTGNAANGDL